MVDLMVNEQQSGTAGKSVPAGFKLTEVGVIPEDWVVISIDDCKIKVGSGKTPTGGASIYVDSGRPFVRSQNVDWGRLDLADVAHIPDDIHSTFSGSEIQQDDVLLNITGASIGRCAKADFRIAGGNVNQHVCIIRIDAKKLSPSLLVELINSNYGQNQIDSYQAGGNREGLNFSQVKNLKFAIAPNSLEQTEIVKALNDINAFTLALEKLIVKKQAIKTATMQQLLTGKTRLPQFALRDDGAVKGYKKSDFGDIPEDWDYINIGKDCSLKARIGWQALTTKEYLRSGAYYLVTGTDFNAGLVDWNSCYFVNEWRYKQDSNIQLKVNDVLITKDGTIGKVGYINTLPLPATLNSGIFLIRPKSDKIIPEYLFFILTSRVFDSFINGITAGSTIVHLYQKDFVHFGYYAPQPEEQIAIAAILSDMDKDIQTLQQRLDKTRQIKQGMMQELLTGKTRLI